MAKRRSKKKKKQKRRQLLAFAILLLLASIILISHPVLRSRIQLLFYKTHENQLELKKSQKHLDEYSVYGIDVSEYQDVIVWEKLAKKEDVDFVFIRATAGINYQDNYFLYNWKESAKSGLIQGAYHYYRPNENSIQQAHTFINHVNLKPGNLPPVLDIEDYSNIQSLSKLKIGLLRWLNVVEQHYGVKPIIYTYYKYYNLHFQHDQRFDAYNFWLARYGNYTTLKKPGDKWIIWQFTQKGQVAGIHGDVDLNVFYSDKNALNNLRIE
ncbi:MAG: glycoside hydrolase family 25 protein [Bacteroidota bacterium]